LGGEIDFHQNITLHWTSQMKIEVVFRRGVERSGVGEGGFAKAVRMN
jgi:hypothetical protein